MLTYILAIFTVALVHVAWPSLSWGFFFWAVFKLVVWIIIFIHFIFIHIFRKLIFKRALFNAVGSLHHLLMNSFSTLDPEIRLYPINISLLLIHLFLILEFLIHILLLLRALIFFFRRGYILVILGRIATSSLVIWDIPIFWFYILIVRIDHSTLRFGRSLLLFLHLPILLLFFIGSLAAFHYLLNYYNK